MAHKEYKRPDEKTMLRIINYNKGLAVEIALRLAWNLGLTRDEMHNLKWSDISFAEKLVFLPDREVPMEDEDASRLEARSKQVRRLNTEYVMFSDRNGSRMAPESISRVVKLALEKGGLKGYTMIDLRQDYVIRMLEKYDWRYAARITGTSVTTLYTNYSEYFVKEGSKAEAAEQGEDIEFKLWKIIRAEGTSPEGLALWMAWKLGMTAQEIVELTWEQVDLKKGIIRIENRNLKVGSEFLAKLKTVKAGRASGADSHVVLTPRAQKGFDAARLSRVLRSALIRGGVGLTLQDIMREGKRKDREDIVVEIVAKQGSATRKGLMRELELTYRQVYYLVDSLLEKGELIQVGQKLYLPGAVVPPEEHYEVIRAHLETVGGALRGDLADLLHIDGIQCGVILRALMVEGKLKRTGYVYSLPEQDTTM